MTDRKLATIQTIRSIEPAQNADSLDIATINNWRCVVRKGEFNVGQKVIFFETDSFLPEKPAFEFLRKSSHKDMHMPDGSVRPGFLLKTIKLRKNVSQGLVLDTSTFGMDEYDVGTDVSKELGVIKFEKPVSAQLRGMVEGLFPNFIPKTSAERLQNLTNPHAYWVNPIATEKLDGTSVTYFKLLDSDIRVCSRNWELKPSDTVYWRFVPDYITDNYAIQGEIFGQGIQKNVLRVEQQFRAFSVYDIELGEYLSVRLAEEFCQDHGIEFVPVLNIPLASMTVDDMFAHADYMKSVLNPDVNAEGFVVHDWMSQSRIKVLSKRYEMKH